MRRIIQYLIRKLFRYETIEYKANLAYQIYIALCTGDYAVLNKYCTSKATIDIMALRLYECQFFRYNHYQYRYDEKDFNSIDILTKLCNNKKNIHISEFTALYFYLKSSLYINSMKRFDTRVNAFEGKEFEIYDKFLDKV